MLTAGIASIDSRSSGALHASLRQTGLVESVTEWVAPSRGGWQLGLGESVPDVVLLDLSVDPEPYFAFAAELKRMRPTTRIVACSARQDLDSELLLQAMRTGVQDFISRPIDLEKLGETLNRIIRDVGGQEPGVRDRVIVVQGAKGGVGTSTVAVNLAVQLAKATEKHTGLIDLGCPLGHLSLLLDLRPHFTIRDAIENMERLDSHFLGGLMMHHKSGVDLLAGTDHGEDWEKISATAVSRLINVAQSMFEYVVVDFGRAYSSEWKGVLGIARNILVVGQADVPSLWSLERQLTDLSSLGLDPARIRPMVNRWQKGDEEALQKFEKSARREIVARIPNDYAQVSEAVNLGVPLSRNHNDPLTSKYRQLATELAGGVAGNNEKRGSRFSLFGKK